MTNPWFIRAIVIIQLLCALFFVSEILVNIIGLRARPISWAARELLEIGAALGLLLGSALGAMALARSNARTRRIEDQLRAASGAFADLVDERFHDWGLTPAEYDVAWFAMKGMSTQEIANLRETSEGTVKAQSNAIYRKAGVSGRYQLLSLFVDELMNEAALLSEERVADELQAAQMPAKSELGFPPPD
ncbi:MAG: DNA-binding CsgD family transcriptional regulator [Paracoccaceae bacterium]